MRNALQQDNCLIILYNNGISVSLNQQIKVITLNKPKHILLIFILKRYALDSMISLRETTF